MGILIRKKDDKPSNVGKKGSTNEGGKKKTKGRMKLELGLISEKERRLACFCKRKAGLMKKAHELSVLTGTEVMVLVASETGKVYTYATAKLRPILTSDGGQALIQTALNSPEFGDITDETMLYAPFSTQNPDLL